MPRNIQLHELQNEDGGTGRHIVIVDGVFEGWLQLDVDEEFWHFHDSNGDHVCAFLQLTDVVEQFRSSAA